MIIKFLLAWSAITALVVSWRYLSPVEVKKDMGLWIRRVLLGYLIAGAFLVAAMFINNLSGV